MKKANFSTLALLGMVGGLVAAGQPGLEGIQDNNSIDLQHVLATPKCASHGCGGLTADNDKPKSSDQEDSDDEDSDQEGDTKNATPPSAKKPAAAAPSQPPAAG